MGLRFRQSFRLWKGASIIWNAPLNRTNPAINGLSSSYGCLGLGFVGVVAFFALMGFVSRDRDSQSSYKPPASFPQPPAASLSLGLSPSAPSNASLPPDSSIAVLADNGVNKSTASSLLVTSNVSGLARVDAAKIYALLDLASKGFEYKRNADHSPLFWTLRKTDADREYTAVFLADDDAKTKAVTLELVSTGTGTNELARNYFKTIVGSFIAPTEKKTLEDWLVKNVGSDANNLIAGLRFILHSTSTHRRLTIQ